MLESLFRCNVAPARSLLRTVDTLDPRAPWPAPAAYPRSRSSACSGSSTPRSADLAACTTQRPLEEIEGSSPAAARLTRRRGRREGAARALVEPQDPSGRLVDHLQRSATSRWLLIYPALLELVRAHRCVRDRRGRRRSRLKRLAEEHVARAPTGCWRAEQCVLIEEELKFPASLASLSSEARHRHGAVDLVQAESVARGRIGRSGAHARRGLEGRIFPSSGPTRRVRGRRAAHARKARSQETVDPAQPAGRAAGAADRRHLRRGGDREGLRAARHLVRGAYPFADLSRASSRTSSTCSRAVIRRTSSRAAAGLHGVVRGRGLLLFGVFLAGGGRRVDEEMV